MILKKEEQNFIKKYKALPESVIEKLLEEWKEEVIFSEMEERKREAKREAIKIIRNFLKTNNLFKKEKKEIEKEIFI